MIAIFGVVMPIFLVVIAIFGVVIAFFLVVMLFFCVVIAFFLAVTPIFCVVMPFLLPQKAITAFFFKETPQIRRSSSPGVLKITLAR